jgi:PAS domain S-box-containing protein
MNSILKNSVPQDRDVLLRLAFWAGNIGFWNWDLLTNDVYLSPIWKSQLGYEEHELPNAFSTWEKLLHPDDFAASWSAINGAKADPNKAYEITFRLMHKDGSYRTILSRGKVYRDQAGIPQRIMGCHVDITQQKLIEDQLRQSETRLHLTLQSVGMGTWEWNLVTNMVNWDEKLRDLFGYPHDYQVTLSSFFDRLHPDDAERIRNELNAVIASNGALHIEFRIVLPDGRVRWMLGDGCILLDKVSKKPIRMIGINYDITENKNALLSLQEAHEFNKQIIEFAQEGIVVYDEELRYLVWNRYMEKISDRTAADVLGKRTLDIFPFLKDSGIVEMLQRALAGDVVLGEDTQFTDPRDNSIHWTTARYGPLRNAQGNIIGVVATIRDITERKRTEERVSANKQRMELVLEQIPSILWTTDLDLVFTSSTGSGLKSLALLPDSVVGQKLTEYLQTSDPADPTIHAHLQAVKGHSVSYDVEFQGRFFHVFIVPLRGTHSELIGTIGLALDISENRRREQEQRELELRVQQAQKLESLEVLAGGIAHDFNNLLTGMLGYASLAILELPTESPVVGMLQEIEKAAQRAAELSRQMLAYSGKGRFVIESIHLDQLVIEMVSLLKTLVSTKAQLQVDAEPAVIEGDATQIRQIVMNLITNAADAIVQGGRIAVRTGVRHFSKRSLKSDVMQSDLEEGSHAYLEVEDNGSGISPEVRKKIFDPFFTTKFTGRGLGLASVRGIVRGHRGIIQVDQIYPQGTLFRVILPLKNGTSGSALASPTATTTASSKGCILVVEDDPSVLEFVKIALQQSGYQVLSCTDARRAIDTIANANSTISAILIDFTMPNLNGVQLSQHIRTVYPQLPILLMSGYAEEEISSQLGDLQLNGFIQKPFKPADLLSKLADITNQEKPANSR